MRTYDEQLKWEIEQINKWLSENKITIIKSIDYAPHISGCKIRTQTTHEYSGV